jgi:formylglycine-generating enzyme required for sulfatase activity
MNIEMITIPAGNYLYRENKQNRKLPEYNIMKNPVTVAQYREFCKINGCKMPYVLPGEWVWNDNHPITMITWREASAFAEWCGLSLPTEEEWEKAARGIDGRNFPWGNEWDASKCCNSVSESAIQIQTCPVGSFPSGNSPYGVQDMSGNVWEWCDSWFDSPGKEKKRRVIRGGSYGNFDINYFRTISRIGKHPHPLVGEYNIGFRCVQRFTELF